VLFGYSTSTIHWRSTVSWRSFSPRDGADLPNDPLAVRAGPEAIRENEPRAVSLGYRVNQYKLTVFVLSAALSGLAGATKAIVFQLASLTDVHWTMSARWC
jgi:hypothetical protein